MIEQEKPRSSGVEAVIPQVFSESLGSHKLVDLAEKVLEKAFSRVKRFTDLISIDLVNREKRGSGRFGSRGRRSKCFSCNGRNHSSGERCIGFSHINSGMTLRLNSIPSGF